MAKAANAPNAFQMNLAARSAILNNAIFARQQIYSKTLTGTIPGNVNNIPLANVGLITGLRVEIAGTIAQSASETQTRTKLGGQNILSQIVLTDLDNYTRVNTSGWHLTALQTAKRGRAYGSAFTSGDVNGTGANAAPNDVPSSVTTADTFRFMYFIPVAYSKTDLRGAMYGSTTGATMQLSLTVNPNFSVGSAADPTLAVYQSSTSGDLATLSNVSVTVYQEYYDQLPVANGSRILPLQDLATIYQLSNTSLTGMAANQDFAVPYSNNREFLSTLAIYDDFGGSTAIGAELNYASLVSANTLQFFKDDPYLISQVGREIFGDDLASAPGRYMYYFDHRSQPINTRQWGNTNLNFNFAHVQASTSQLLIGWESFARQIAVTQAGSLANA